LIYPAHQVTDLAWPLIPFWGLAAWELAHHLGLAWEDRPMRWLAGVQAGFLFVLFVVLRLNSLAWQNTPAAPPEWFWMVVIAIPVMGLVSTLMVGFGWSFGLAGRGAVWGIAAALSLALVGSSWWTAQTMQNQPEDLWYPAPTIGQETLLMSTLGDLSEWATGHRAEIDVVVADSAPSLRWALRSFPNARFVAGLAITEQPSVIITPLEQNSLNLPAAYRGQDFIWWTSPGWQGAIPPDWLSWLALRKAPIAQAGVILWARADLFPDGVLTYQEPALDIDLEEQIPQE